MTNFEYADNPEARPVLLDAIMHSAIDAIIVIDHRGIVREANPATEEMFGFPVTNLVGRNVSILMPATFADQHDRYVAEYLRTGDRKIIGVGREVVGRRSDGSEFPVHLAVSEMQIGDERCFAGIVRDISDLKSAQAALREINDQLEDRIARATIELQAAQDALVQREKLAMLGQISGGIAHEIRNPLNAVKTSVYFLTHAKNVNDQKRQEHLERIDRQVALINDVVTTLADFARSPGSKLGPCGLAELLPETIQQVNPTSKHVVELQIDPRLAEVDLDQRQMAIVFQNLIRNAIDAMPEGGRLTIKVVVEDDGVSVSFHDQGQGIAPADLDRIMEPFFSTKARGMGLGLPICKTFVQQNGGQLTVTSQVGTGSVFTVWLPNR